MSQKFCINETGNYIGSFDGAAPPTGAIEVPIPPAHGGDVWDFDAQAWLGLPLEQSLQEQVRAAYVTLDLALQEKYEPEILSAAFHLERENLPMVFRKIEQAEAKLVLPEEAAVKAIIDMAKGALA